MTVEVALVISGVSLAFALYQGITNLKRNKAADDKKEATDMTTVVIKLETISNNVMEVKNDMKNIREDVKEDRERIIKIEESVKQAHKRLDSIEPRKQV
jgi:predicted RNase H-like nuclease (RuvC/YqgF family)